MSGKKIPWGPSCDVDDEDAPFVEPVSCKEVLAWLKKLKKHLEKVTAQLDELIEKWPSICRGKSQATLQTYLEHIWKIERELLKFPPLGRKS